MTSKVRSIDWKNALKSRYFKMMSRILPDKIYLRYQFKRHTGYSLNLENPRTFNEKLNWLKLYFRNPLFTRMADKFQVKDIVRNSIGEEYVVPLLGHWNDVNDIDFEKLPYPCVLKATNDSGGSVVCKDFDSIDVMNLKRRLSRSLNRNWYTTSKEWAYKNINPLIIADKYLDDHSGHELTDYKFWCFSGKPKIMYCTNKAEDIYENFYDMDFKPLDINHGLKRRCPEFEKPEKFELMKSLCENLLKGIDLPFVRIDFFYVNGHVFFGEFTFYDWGGMRPFAERDMDYKLGELIELPVR